MTWERAIRLPSTWSFMCGMLLIASEAILKVDELRFFGFRSDVIGVVVCLAATIAGRDRKEHPSRDDGERAE